MEQSQLFKFPSLINAKIHQREDPNYVMGTTILTLIVGVFVFLVALSWNDLAQLTFEKRECKEGDINKAFKYALVITVTAILLIYFAITWIPGKKL